MGRRENRRTQRATSTETTEPPEGDDSVFQTGTSLQDLSTTAEPTQFDQTFQVDSSDISVSPDANIPIAKPWEGIPRAAVVFNLNYIYNEERGEWVRQKKSDLQADDPEQDDPIKDGGDIGDPGYPEIADPTFRSGVEPDATATVDFPNPALSVSRT